MADVGNPNESQRDETARTPEPVEFGERSPREASDADCPGSYQIAVRAAEAEVDPGGEIHLEIFFVGYGNIRGSKLTFYPPTYFVDPSRSTIRYGMAIRETGAAEYGAMVTRIDAGGWTMHLSGGGFKNELWEEATWFFDISPRAVKEKTKISSLASERSYRLAPLEMNLRVQDVVPTGLHTLTFFFTYFNGSEWETDTRSVEILVRNWVRRHEVGSAVIGIVVAAVALLATVGDLLLQLTSFILDYILT